MNRPHLQSMIIAGVLDVLQDYILATLGQSLRAVGG